MNLIFGVTIVLIIAIVNIESSDVSSEPYNRYNDSYNDMLECKAATGATELEFERRLRRLIPTTKVEKCLLACVLKKMELMTHTLLVPELLFDLVIDETLIGSKGKILEDDLKEIGVECKTVSHPDECESAAKILTCLNAATRKRGYCPNVF